MAKARKSKLKVFRTPIGFHDAYVAAPSQKAALEAWGSDVNLFARGSAEEVTDPELTKEPLKRPGEVIRRLRASEAEQIRALGAAPAKAERRAADDYGGGAKGKTPSGPSRSREERKKRPPRPSRAAVEKAERALEAAEDKHRAAAERIKSEIAKLEAKRRELDAKHRSERERLHDQAERARAEYAAGIAEWAEQ